MARGPGLCEICNQYKPDCGKCGCIDKTICLDCFLTHVKPTIDDQYCEAELEHRISTAEGDPDEG